VSLSNSLRQQGRGLALATRWPQLGVLAIAPPSSARAGQLLTRATWTYNGLPGDVQQSKRPAARSEQLPTPIAAPSQLRLSSKSLLDHAAVSRYRRSVQLASGKRCGFLGSHIKGGMTFVILNALSDVLVRPTYLVLPSRSNPCAETPGHQGGNVCCNDAVDKRIRIPSPRESPQSGHT